MYCDLPTFGRCCFCMPLRKGVLVFGYINFVLNVLMLAAESYAMHNDNIYLSSPFSNIQLPEELQMTNTCLEIVFCAALIYGAHTKGLLYIKAYYYFSITTIVLSTVLHIVDFSISSFIYSFIFMVPLIVCETVIEIYLLFLIRSLIQKLSVSKDHRYENPLEQIVYGGEGTATVNGNATPLPEENN